MTSFDAERPGDLRVAELGLRPIYHRKPARADGHLFITVITVIAYQLFQVIRTRLRARGDTPAGQPCDAPSRGSSASPPPSADPTDTCCTSAQLVHCASTDWFENLRPGQGYFTIAAATEGVSRRPTVLVRPPRMWPACRVEKRVMRLLPRRKTYAVIGDPKEIGEVLARRVRRQDRCEVRPGAWLVRSRRQTAAAGARKLGISARTMALVITAQYYSGYAETDVVETMEAWDRESWSG